MGMDRGQVMLITLVSEPSFKKKIYGFLLAGHDSLEVE